MAEVDALAEAVEPRYRCMVLLAAWCSLRFGELAALSPANIDLLDGVIRVEEAGSAVSTGGRVPGMAA